MEKKSRIPRTTTRLRGLEFPLLILLSLLSSQSGAFSISKATPMRRSPLILCDPLWGKHAMVYQQYDIHQRLNHHRRRSSCSIRLQGSGDDDDQKVNESESLGSGDEALQNKVEQQQQQIDQLLSMMKAQQQQAKPDDKPDGVVQPTPPPKRQKLADPIDLPASPPTLVAQATPFVATAAVNPLKAMMFIDGTWLYYSVHEREARVCPIIQRYGRGWQRSYYFDWSALPRVICSALQKQDAGWAVQARPVEIVRASVFTSYKADTSPTSYRFQMYQDMSNANYDVHMIETVGKSEKCVDIKIAVDMLHYATVPNAYDVALLLTGDKDFMPAMIRTRQKGRRVALVSMRSSCNRALCEAPTDSNNNNEHNHNIRDYDVVWIEDYLDDLIKPLSNSDTVLGVEGGLTEFTLMKVVSDFISKSGLSRVSSRDIGTCLKTLRIGNCSLLEELKACYGGLYQFFSTSECFFIEAKNDREELIVGRYDKSYWVGVRSDADVTLMNAAKTAKLSPAEKVFFDGYSLEPLEDNEDSYFFSLQLLGRIDAATPSPRFDKIPSADPNSKQEETPELELPEELTQNYSELTVPKLKEYCQERELKVSGTKAELLERIQVHVDGQVNKLQKEHEETQPSSTKKAESQTTGVGYIESLVLEFIHAKGGQANSRELGRYLSANKASPARLAMAGGGLRVSALHELKESHGSIIGFVMERSSLFERRDLDPRDFPDDDAHWQHAFYIASLQSPTSFSSTPLQKDPSLAEEVS